MTEPTPELLEACEEWLYQNDLLSKGMGQLLAAFVQAREQAAHECGAMQEVERIVKEREQAVYERGADQMLNAIRGSLERIKQAARLDEAKWWRNMPPLVQPDSYFAVEGDKRIAALESKEPARLLPLGYHFDWLSLSLWL